MKSRTCRLLALLSLLAICRVAQGAAAPAWTVRAQPLPRTMPTGAALDFIAFDPATRSLWVPAGNTGTIAVIDVDKGTSRTIEAPTAEVKRGERTMVVGPSSVVIGLGKVFVGNRGDASVCAFDPRTLAKVACHRLDSMPDCLAVDAARGRVYTNLEDKDRTLALDARSRKTLATWNPACGPDRPHGLRVDPASGRLLVACSTRAEVLDAPRDGKVISTIDTDDGVVYLAHSGRSGLSDLVVVQPKD